jgi:hypothetical protein
MLLQVGCAAWACLGMVCVGPDRTPPSLPAIHLEDIRLQLLDPSDGRAAARLAWSWPDDREASYFEIYMSLDRDSLGSPLFTRPASESTYALVPLPDSTRDFTHWFGVRAVLLEPTGQRIPGDSIPAGSLAVTAAVNVLKPASGSHVAGRLLAVEVQTRSDDGIVLRQSLHEMIAGSWTSRQDTCLPREACGRPIFGASIQRDETVMQGIAAGDTVETLLCVLGSESFDDDLTGRKQSLACTRFFRVGE